MSGFYSELKRRNVFRVAIGYILVAWVILQIADVLFPALTLPDWTISFVAGLMILGFPLALFFAWAYELTPEGLKRERDVDRSRSITQQTGRKIDFIVIAVLAVAVLLFAYDKFGADDATPDVATDGGPRSIAVLPFSNMSADPANDYFSDGISEELLNLLAQIPELRVIGRTSSFQFRDENVDLREIGRVLGVTEILEGSVRRSGNRVRITAQLVSADDGAHLWSDRYEDELDDIFRVQDTIARAVVKALRLELLGDVPGHDAVTSPEAYELYLQGRFAYRRFGEGDLETALRYFDEALAVDPEFADAWESKASVLINHTLGGKLPLDEGIERTHAALERALELDPDDAAANYGRGFVAMAFERNWQDARAAMAKAISIEPNYSAALSGLGLLELALGDAGEAVELLKKSVAADPLRVASRHNLGFIYYNAGQSQQAVEMLQNAYEYAPDFTRSHFRLALAFLTNGDAEQALVHAEQERGEQWRLAGLAIVLHELGRRDEADAALAELSQRFESEASYAIAAAHAVHGNPDAAFEWIDRAIERNDPLLPWIGWDPMMASLRDDPRFGGILERLDLPAPQGP